ncbi:MAG: hypothetical protein M3198_12055 [Actinomycetota bacterium]|nr:hypothetical protein [Actinomycetota bacterium]
MGEPDARRRWLLHVLLLCAGGFFGALVALGLQLMWQLPCEAGAIPVGEQSSCDAFAISLLPTLFGALFGAVAADLIWSRRR